jgi:hypothetical protein
MRSNGTARWLGAAALSLLLVAVAGCGGRLYPVRGKVTFEDGTPLSKGTVVFESIGGEKAITARGAIQPGGSYQLSTYKPGDGAPAGKYRVLVAPMVDLSSYHPERDVDFDPRFSAFNTSGLEFDVKPGENEFPIQVARIKRARR